MSSGPFISDVIVVSSKEKCPAGYSLVSVTVHGNDASLYESSLVKRGERYICFAKIPGSNIIVTDLNVVKEKDTIPTGFTGVKNCHNDAGEKALRKHVLCVKTDSIQKAQSGLVDIVAVQHSKGESSPRNCYTITNDVNGINICYQTAPNMNVRQPPPYGHQANMPYRPPTLQPGFSGNGVPYPSQHGGPHVMPTPVAYQGRETLAQFSRQQSAGKLTSAIQGVPFQVNPKFEFLWKKSDLSQKATRIRSVDDIEKEYCYSFEKERKLLSTR